MMCQGWDAGAGWSRRKNDLRTTFQGRMAGLWLIEGIK